MFHRPLLALGRTIISLPISPVPRQKRGPDRRRLCCRVIRRRGGDEFGPPRVCSHSQNIPFLDGSIHPETPNYLRLQRAVTKGRLQRRRRDRHRNFSLSGLSRYINNFPPLLWGQQFLVFPVAVDEHTDATLLVDLPLLPVEHGPTPFKVHTGKFP